MLKNELFEETKEVQTYKIIAPPNHLAERIDKFITNSIANISRAKVQTLIDMENVLKNKTTVQRPSEKVYAGDVLSVEIPRLKMLAVEPENIPLEIVYEDEHILVINKAPDMVVHPAVGNRTGTLVNALANYCTTLSTINGVYRPGIVHRLDKDTSGIIIAAKNDNVHNLMARKFENREIKKYYAALVWGNFKEKSGQIINTIGRSKSNRKKYAVLKNEGKYAESHYDVLEQFSFLSFIRVRIVTGRTHQIRVHFSHLNHPVLGDIDYGGRTKRLKSLNPKDKFVAVKVLDTIHRQALHSNIVEFDHPITLEPMRIIAPVPEDMEKVLTILRESTGN